MTVFVSRKRGAGNLWTLAAPLLVSFLVLQDNSHGLELVAIPGRFSSSQAVASGRIPAAGAATGDAGSAVHRAPSRLPRNYPHFRPERTDQHGVRAGWTALCPRT